MESVYPSSAAGVRKNRRTAIAVCEALEDRTVLSAWYVSPLGSDANPGTRVKPFLTIQHAADLAQPGDTVFLRRGTYREMVVPANSGAAGAPITFRPSKKEVVTIDGADPLGGWSAQPGGIYQTSVPWDLGQGKNQVFEDGQMLSEARWPNTDYAVAADASVQPASNGIATATLSVPQLQDPPGTWRGATIHIASGQGWVFQTGTVTDSAPGSLTFTFAPLDPYEFQTPQAGDRFYLTGVPAALDAPGEWFRDPAGTLLLRPPTGGVAGHSIEMKHRLYAFDLSGRSYIDIQGVRLLACTINTDDASTNNVIDSITATYVSHNLDRPDPWAIKLHPHTTGIILNGTANVIQNSTIAFSSGDGVFLGGSGNTVQNCVIHDVDYGGGDEAGVSTLGADENVIGNTIYNTARGGIVFRFSPAISILHNRVYNCGLQTTDVGALYTWMTDGQGGQIAWNVISDTRSSGFGGSGIYLDDGSSHYAIHHNVVWNCDSALRMNPPSEGNLVYNNTLVSDHTALETAGNADMTGSSFANNLFAGAATIGQGAADGANMLDAPETLFANPMAHNYRLRRRSAAIDAGQVIAPYTDGYRGAAPDLGAYESGSPPFTAGAVTANRKRGSPPRRGGRGA